MLKSKKNIDRWRILAYKYGHEEQSPSNFDGHASAIHFNSSCQSIEFVDNNGYLTNALEEVSWEKFDLGAKNNIYLYVYKCGAIEYIAPKNK